jgi:hypothetical protein
MTDDHSLRDEYGFIHGIAMVRNFVAGAQLLSRKLFILLSYKPDHTRVDFSEADGTGSAGWRPSRVDGASLTSKRR